MQIEMMPVDRLIPYIRNARTHSADQVAQIAASIVEFGFTNPLLIGEDDVIIAGHGRLLAAKQLGLAEVPVIVLDHLSEAQRRALVIADNRIAENAGWDDEMLRGRTGRAARRGLRSRSSRLRRRGDRRPARGLGDPMAPPAPRPERAAEGDASPASPSVPGNAGALAERFGVPPFSILDARKGWWQDRKRAWIDLGIRSELGRGAAPGGSARPLDRAKAKEAGAWLRASPGPSGRI